MKLLRSKIGRWVAAVVLLLALFLVRPGAQRLQTRIVRSISLALGRQVDVGSVRLRLLPQPGFDLESFVVHDDPAFSAEPLLRSQEVTAALRVSSLLRGRLEIARLSLTEPSLNLVRNPEGHWNLENLLERAAQVPVAPTSKATMETRPAFPYIEADHGRINFKFGAEKKPYALTEADFAIWQDSENAWGARLQAQPVRTDFNLTDTGLLKINGSWRRAGTLRNTPLQFSLQWDRAQLGQFTKLALGNDKGWRGTTSLSATLSGTPADLAVDTNASVQDFRRYDIPAGAALRLAVHCHAHYSSVDHTVSRLSCQAPVGGGAIAMDGRFALSDPRNYDLNLNLRDVPMQSVVELARHAKKNLPDDLVAAGKLDAHVTVRREAGAGGNVIWEGGGETLGFRLGSKLTKAELLLDRIPFAISPGGGARKNIKSAQRRFDRGVMQSPAGVHVDVGPFTLALGRPTPVTFGGWISRTGYNLSINGETEVQRLLRVARIVGLPTAQPAAAGVAKVDLQIGGGWSGFAQPQAVGKAQLRSIQAEVRGLSAPLEIASANVSLTPDEIIVQNIVSSVARGTWRGSLTLARQCASPGTCPVRFDLRADEIATDELNQMLSPHAKTRPWYRFLSSPAQAGIPYLASLHAVGKLAADRVLIHKLVADRVSANVELENGKLRLDDLRGDLFGGRHTGEWKADFTTKPPEYSGSGTVERVALGQLAEAMKDGWITGMATATYHAATAGSSTAELISSASAILQLDLRDGLLPHIALASGTGPLRIHRFVGRLQLRDGKVEIQQGKLDTASGIYQLSGTASLTRVLDVKLARDGAPGFSITGTLTEPHVAPASPPETRAALKP